MNDQPRIFAGHQRVGSGNVVGPQPVARQHRRGDPGDRPFEKRAATVRQMRDSWMPGRGHESTVHRDASREQNSNEQSDGVPILTCELVQAVRADRGDFSPARHVTNVSPLLVFGTRPEAIKMAPLVLACAPRDEMARPTVCTTGQHREMLAPVMDYFGIVADVDLAADAARPDAGRADGPCLQGVRAVIERQRPDCVVVQGDTTTAMAAALAAFYERVPLVHVEAGLRTGNLHAPWPEELNRRMVTLAAGRTLRADARAPPKHWWPKASRGARSSRHRQHRGRRTVVDGGARTAKRRDRGKRKYAELAAHRWCSSPVIAARTLATGWRGLCEALSRLAAQFPDVQFLYPVHLNPNVQATGACRPRRGERTCI